MNTFKTLLKGDIKNIFRDGILIMTLFGTLLLSCVFKLIPHFTKIITLPFDISPYYDLLTGFALTVMSLLIGCMTAFILIEEKDEGLLTYFSVTPLGKNGYLFYRLITPIILNSILLFILIPWMGLIKINFIPLLFIVILASIEAVLIVLFLTTYASNRVEGLALSKAIGVLLIIPILDRFFDFKFSIIYYLFPTYYIPKALSLLQTKSFYLLLITGYLLHLAFFLLLYHKFNKKML